MIKKMIFGLLILAATQSAFADKKSEAMASGTSLGKTSLPSSLTDLSSAGSNVNKSKTKPKDTPLYTPTQPNSANYDSGLSLFNQGATAIDKCRNYVPGPDAVANQECEGVNFLAKNPIQKQFVIQPNDPALVAAKFAVDNAKDGSTPGSQCVTKTVVVSPAVNSIESCTQARITDNLDCGDDLICKVTGRTSKCVAKSFKCASWADSCCYFNITCNANGNANLVYHDCCGATYNSQNIPMSGFTAPGVAYNANSMSRIRCDQSSGYCQVDMTDYYCSDPSDVIAFIPNTNSFYFDVKAIVTCSFNGGCDALGARVQ